MLLSKWTVALLVISSLSLPYSSAERNSDILLHQTSIQLKLFDNAFHFFHAPPKAFNYSIEAQNGSEPPSWSSENILVSRLVPDQSAFTRQSEQGLAYVAEEMVTFWYNTTSPTTTAFSLLVKIQDQGHTLRAFIQPFKSDETEGYRNATLVDEKWNAIGEVKVAYLIIRPITLFNPLVAEYSNTDHVFFMGHRGTGKGRRLDLAQEYLENTIAAFNYACSKGADMIELDVQLSSDKVPIIYHDFSVKSYLTDRSNLHHNVSITLPFKDVSHHAFTKISTNFMPHLRHGIDTLENQSFETLENVLKKLKPGCGINVEIKYPQLRKTLKYEGVPGIEMNEFVDRIFAVLYAHSASRPIVITSFNADLCAMVQLKQNKFRVALLTFGAKGSLYDPRAGPIELGLAYSESLFLKGLSLHAPDVLAEPKHIPYIRSRNQTLYLWGDALNSYELLMQMKKDGVNALIFDKLDILLANHTTHH